MNISIPPRGSKDPLPRFVDELIQVGGSLSQIVAHMAMSRASGRSASDAPALGGVLAGLLESVLAPLAETHGDDALAQAADVVAAAGAQIAAEIVLVPHEDDLEDADADWPETA